MEDYDDVHAAYYDLHSSGVPGDVEFYVEQARGAGSPVLELACGTGRILIPSAEAGLRIIGLDRSAHMLAVARRKVASLPVDVRDRIKLIEGDMRSFSLTERFGLISVPYRAFLHLLTVEDQCRALGCIREHLADNGRLVLNIFDPRLDIIEAHAGPLGGALKMMEELVDPSSGRRVVVWDTRRYDPEAQTVRQHFIYEELDEANRVLARSYTSFTLRYLYRYEMQHLLALSGFKVEALYGDFGRGPFRYGGEQIWVAGKA